MNENIREMNRIVEEKLNSAISQADDDYRRSKMQDGDFHSYTINYKHKLDELKKCLALLKSTYTGA